MTDQIPRLTREQKAAFFDAIFAAEYEELIRIDISDGMAATLYATDRIWKTTLDIRYDYEEVLRNYILDVSVDTKPEMILKALSLNTIQEKLREHPSYIVHYTVHDGNGKLCLKQAVFFSQEDCVLLAVQDISSSFENISRQIESLTSALADARQEISEKNTFLSLMNQNIRTPLYSIMGLTRITEENPAPDAFDDYLHKISQYGTYMQESIDDILSLRQIANRQMHLEPIAIDLGDFFRNIDRMIHPLISEKGLLFELDTSQLSFLRIIADYRCLQQIILKMLRSAIGYTVRGGRIRLRGRTLVSDSDTVTLEFSVENKGLIIDRERLEMLFKPYDYLRGKLDRHINDLDISLIILRSSLLAMGADTILAESDESKGTRISISLKVPYAEKIGAAHAAPAIPDFDGRRVLLVDDNEISLEVSEKLLFNKGIDVVKACNGQEALTLYTEYKGAFDLILMDVLMPVMDGLEAARRIRALKEIPGSDTIPIIALTVNAFRENFEESLHAGMNDHLVKPIEPMQLYQVLMEYMGK